MLVKKTLSQYLSIIKVLKMGFGRNSIIMGALRRLEYLKMAKKQDNILATT
ncbi:MAG TPA: hypothetical protein EYQ45_04675 [Flavobacteriaceae bacterium]|nr:hypothetical protein [Flavobacteriaceae bacterium]